MEKKRMKPNRAIVLAGAALVCGLFILLIYTKELDQPKHLNQADEPSNEQFFLETGQAAVEEFFLAVLGDGSINSSRILKKMMRTDTLFEQTKGAFRTEYSLIKSIEPADFTCEIKSQADEGEPGFIDTRVSFDCSGTKSVQAKIGNDSVIKEFTANGYADIIYQKVDGEWQIEEFQVHMTDI